MSHPTNDLEVIFDSVPAMIFFKDQENRFLRVNRAFVSAMNMSKDMLEGRSCFDIFPREQAEKFWEDDKKVLSSGQGQRNIIEPMDTPHMGTRWVQTDKIPCRDQDGQVQGIIGFSVDITERYLMEQEIRASKTLLDHIINLLPARIFWKDHQSVYLGCNKIFAEDAGLSSPEEIIGKNDFVLGWKDQAELYRADDRLVMDQGSPKLNYIEPQTTPEGQRIWLSTSKVPLTNPQGESLGVLGTYIDITEQKEAESRLKASEDKITRLIENLKGEYFLYRHNRNGIFTDVSDSITGILGYSQEEFLKHYAEYLTENPINKQVEEYTNLSLQGQQQPSYLVEIYHKDGTVKCLEVSEYPIFDEAGQVTAIEGLARDITEAKENEEKLKAAKAYSEMIFQVTPSAIFTVDTQMRILSWNKKAEEITGFRAEEMLGHSCRMFADAPCKDHCSLFDAAVPKPVAKRECVIIRKDGQRRIISKNADLLKNVNGDIIGGIESFEDITERVENQERIAKELHKNSAIASVVGQIVYEHYLPSDLIVWSGSFDTILGYTAEELGQDSHGWLDKVHPEDLKRVKEELSSAIQEDRQFDMEYRFRHKDGQYLWFHDRGVVKNMDDGTSSNIGVMEDITERKRRYRELQEHAIELNASMDCLEIERNKLVEIKEELQRSNKELEQFAYVASHDLQEPLRMIASYTQLLERRYHDLLDERGKKYIHFAVDGASRMQQLISDLLTFSRVGLAAKEFELIDSSEVYEQAISNLAVAIQESGASVNCDGLPKVCVDESQLVQLFQNLISNAIKFRGSDPPKVKIQAVEQEQEWLFSVADNGIGLDEQYQERIFLIFQRLHSRTDYQGTGIGLAVCKKIVERHGGRIWAESKDSAGSVFFFTIPKCRCQQRSDP